MAGNVGDEEYQPAVLIGDIVVQVSTDIRKRQRPGIDARPTGLHDWVREQIFLQFPRHQQLHPDKFIKINHLADLQAVFHPLEHYLGLFRLSDKIINAELVAFDDIGGIHVPGNHQHRGMGYIMFLDPSQEVQTIHLGHVHIKHDQIHGHGFKLIQGFLSVRGDGHLIARIA